MKIMPKQDNIKENAWIDVIEGWKLAEIRWYEENDVKMKWYRRWRIVKVCNDRNWPRRDAMRDDSNLWSYMIVEGRMIKKNTAYTHTANKKIRQILYTAYEMMCCSVHQKNSSTFNSWSTL